MVDQIVAFALLGADWVLYLLAALSVLSVAVIVERGLFFYHRRIDHEKLQKEAVRAIQEDTVNALTKSYKDNETMAARVALAGVRNRESGVAAASEAMNSAKIGTQEEYEKLTVILGTLGNNAPFIGLFGTVLGIIKAFNDLQANPTGGINAIMGSTSEALVATAVGILVAIPAVVAFNLFNRLLRSHLSQSDALAHAILSAMHGQRSAEEKGE
jgi:biopolymer transport protein ExbB/TolQ